MTRPCSSTGITAASGTTPGEFPACRMKTCTAFKYAQHEGECSKDGRVVPLAIVGNVYSCLPRRTCNETKRRYFQFKQLKICERIKISIYFNFSCIIYFSRTLLTYQSRQLKSMNASVRLKIVPIIVRFSRGMLLAAVAGRSASPRGIRLPSLQPAWNMHRYNSLSCKFSDV